MKPYQQSLAFLLVTGLGFSSMTALARDVQLRDRPGDDQDTTQAQAIQVQKVDTESMSTDDRLRRLERILESQGLVSLMVQQQELQQELQRLRGEIEVQSHTLEELKKRQRELYVDIDRRLLAVERNGGQQGGARVSTPVSSKPASSPVTSSSPASSPAQAKDEQQSYQKAFDLLRALRYDKAIEAFQEFLQRFPNGRYAHIAQYWIGEANYAQRRFDDAIKDYQALLTNHPNSPKLAEAMLKIGYSQFELKRYDEARESLERLIKTYPGTTEAGQGQNLLQKIKLQQSEGGTP